jgi:hypothetical protein
MGLKAFNDEELFILIVLGIECKQFRNIEGLIKRKNGSGDSIGIIIFVRKVFALKTAVATFRLPRTIEQ